MAKKNAVVSTSIAGTVLTISVVGMPDIILDAADCIEDIRTDAMMHGFKQKAVDAAAMPKDDDGNPATPASKHAAILSVVNQVKDGDWNKRGEASGDSAPSGLIFRAYAEHMTNLAAANDRPIPTTEWLRTKYDARDRSAQLKLRDIPEIAAIMERIKSARGAGKAAKVNSDDLLAELG